MSGYSKTARRTVFDSRKKEHTYTQLDKLNNTQGILRKEDQYKWEHQDICQKTISVRKGRFLITTTVSNDKQVVTLQKGRFLITQYLLRSKQETKKPFIVRKGRFLITTY